MTAAAAAASGIVFRAESAGPGPRAGGGTTSSTQERVSWLKTAPDGGLSGCVPKDPVLHPQIEDLLVPKAGDLGKLIGSLGGGVLAAALTPSLVGTSAQALPPLAELEARTVTHFHELTLKFLRPFDIYLQADLKPIMINPIQDTPTPPTFTAGPFLESLRASSLVEAPFSLMPKAKSVLTGECSSSTFVWL